MQALSQGMDRLLPTLVDLLVELTGAKGVLARNDPKVRLLEGLEQTVDELHGEVPETVTVREGAVEYDVDPRRGQKTGLFLDQRENREAAARYAHGRLLDCFSYNGGFALALAPRCTSVEALDVSADAVARIAANAARKRLSPRDGARSQRLRRAAPPRTRRRALRHHRPRPAGVRQEQGVARRRRWPATRRSISARCGC